ncbi:MAG TPA: hypothetical protein VLZ84_01995, partial [Asticcacaulis sp.]|nr:hypothetical protein [Asticcacaulis sp.]
LRNTLFSLLFCFGLIVAYYATTGNQPLPPDTYITYESVGVFRLDIDTNGHVRLADQQGIYSYKISKFAVRRILRTFRQVDFLGRDILAYGDVHTNCILTLTENHQKAAIRHDCETRAMELLKPAQTLNQVTRFRSILKGDKAAMRDYNVKSDRTMK